jgi:hypothetical protein
MNLSEYRQIAHCFFVGVALAITAVHASAQDVMQSRFEVSAPSTVLITEEIVYAVKMEAYSSPLTTPLPIQAPLANGAERVAIDWLNTMQRASFVEYLSFFDAQSRAATESINRSLGRGESFWVEKWKRDLKGVSVRFTRRVTYSNYTVLMYQTLLADGQLLPEEGVALRQENGEWKVTLDLASSPILTAWNQPGLRVRRADQSFFGGRKEGIRDVLSLSEKLNTQR